MSVVNEYERILIYCVIINLNIYFCIENSCIFCYTLIDICKKGETYVIQILNYIFDFYGAYCRT